MCGQLYSQMLVRSTVGCYIHMYIGTILLGNVHVHVHVTYRTIQTCVMYDNLLVLKLCVKVKEQGSRYQPVL